MSIVHENNNKQIEEWILIHLYTLIMNSYKKNIYCRWAFIFIAQIDEKDTTIIKGIRKFSWSCLKLPIQKKYNETPLNDIEHLSYKVMKKFSNLTPSNKYWLLHPYISQPEFSRGKRQKTLNHLLDLKRLLRVQNDLFFTHLACLQQN